VSGSENWRDVAVCGGTDPEIFFPRNRGRITWGPARAICSECPVSDQCLEETMKLEGEGASLSVRFGMFGGLTPEERYTLDAFRSDLAVSA
jgi:hypothetical protein